MSENISENIRFKNISLPGDLDNNWFQNKADELGLKSGFLFYINGILTRGVCSVNERDKTYVAEVVSLDDGMWYERRGFCEFVVMTHGFDDEGKRNVVGGGEEILRIRGDRMNE